jgi:hypothetical protein
VGWPVDKHTGRAIALLPAEAWTPMIAVDGLPGVPATLDADSGPDTVGEVAEITHLLAHLRHWPAGLRVFVRLSHRMIGAHLYRIFPKLAITSRAALRDALSKLPSQGQAAK